MKHLYGLFSLILCLSLISSSDIFSQNVLELDGITNNASSACQNTTNTVIRTFTMDATNDDNNTNSSAGITVTPCSGCSGVTANFGPSGATSWQNSSGSTVELRVSASAVATAGDYVIQIDVTDADGFTNNSGEGTVIGGGTIYVHSFIFTVIAQVDVQTFNNFNVTPGATGNTIVNVVNADEGVTDFGLDVDGGGDDMTINNATDGQSAGPTAFILDGENDIEVTMTVNYPSADVAAVTISVENITSGTGGHQGQTASTLMQLTGTSPCNSDNSSGTITALPIDLRYFRGLLQGNNVTLEWATEYEYNNDYFEVERSFDGYKYNALANILAAGESFDETLYSYEDSNVKGGNAVYYRLKQVDYDGVVNYSEAINLELTGNNVFDLTNMYAESESLNIDYTSDSEKEVTAVIYDLSGRVLVQNTFYSYEGYNNASLDISDLNNGFYIINLYDGQNQVTNKFVKN